MAVWGDSMQGIAMPWLPTIGFQIVPAKSDAFHDEPPEGPAAIVLDEYVAEIPWATAVQAASWD